MDITPDAVSCSACGTKNRPGAAFCENCGRKLAAAGEPSSTPPVSPSALTPPPAARTPDLPPEASAQPQSFFSADGAWWWNGTQWVATQPVSAPTGMAAPKKQKTNHPLGLFIYGVVLLVASFFVVPAFNALGFSAVQSAKSVEGLTIVFFWALSGLLILIALIIWLRRRSRRSSSVS